jgi:hypothetical protein
MKNPGATDPGNHLGGETGAAQQRWGAGCLVIRKCRDPSESQQNHGILHG